MKRFLIATIALIAATAITTNRSYDEEAMLMVMPFIAQLKSSPTIFNANTMTSMPNPYYDPKASSLLVGVSRDYDSEAARYHYYQSQN